MVDNRTANTKKTLFSRKRYQYCSCGAPKKAFIITSFDLGFLLFCVFRIKAPLLFFFFCVKFKEEQYQYLPVAQ